MSQAAKAQEPSMEEILASIRRIIADDEAKPAAKAPEPAPAAPPRLAPVAVAPPAAPPPEPEAMSQEDIDAMLAGFDAAPIEPEPEADAKLATVDEPDDVLELTEAMEAPPEAAASFRTIEAQQDVVFTEAEPARAPAVSRMAPVDMDAPAHDEAQPLLSSHATSAVSSAFGSLAHTVLANNGRTLDDLVREMLRPMLKSWLDDNLPTIVERLVRAEIERVSRGRG